jgi:hypothetical protein
LRGVERPAPGDGEVVVIGVEGSRALDEAVLDVGLPRGDGAHDVAHELRARAELVDEGEGADPERGRDGAEAEARERLVEQVVEDLGEQLRLASRLRLTAHLFNITDVCTNNCYELHF